MSVGRIFLLQELTASRLVRTLYRIVDIRSQTLPLRVILKLVESSPHFLIALHHNHNLVHKMALFFEVFRITFCAHFQITCYVFRPFFLVLLICLIQKYKLCQFMSFTVSLMDIPVCVFDSQTSSGNTHRSLKLCY